MNGEAKVPISSHRIGGVVGKHEVIIAGNHIKLKLAMNVFLERLLLLGQLGC